ncbi:MAG: pilin [Mariprofundaceae bacterium]|nr:pilin [Mariprofundaceae bacterium]
MQIDKAGFTLFELLIVMSIVSILATIALPSVHDRMIRVQVQEALKIAEMGQDAIEFYYKERADFPKDNAEAGLPDAQKIMGNFLESLEVKQGALYLTLGKKVNANVQGKTLVLRPAIVAGEPRVPISWVCAYASVPKGMKVMGGEHIGTLESRFLPVSCRF